MMVILADNPLKGAIEELDRAIEVLEDGLKGPTAEKSPSTAKSLSAGDTSEEQINARKAKKDEKERKKQQKKAAAVSSGDTGVDQNTANFLQCNLRVGRVESVGHHEEADGLYVLKVNYGKGKDSDEDEVRTVCAGLRGFVPEDQLLNHLVVTITNLKPRKLRGITSEAMILAGSVVGGEGSKEVVKPIVPPESAKEGLVIGIGEGEERDLNPKNVSSKLWDKVGALFSVIDGKACYDKKPMTVLGAPVSCDLPDGSEIH